MKDWNKKKLTALVCAGLMAGTLLPCGTVSADSVTITDASGSLPSGAKTIGFDPMGYYGMGSITLENSGDILVLDFSGTSYKSFLGGFADEETAISNYQVSLRNGIVDGYVYGGYSYGAATDNTVKISGDSTVKRVYGGYSNSFGSVTGNTVTISGGMVNDVYGGRSYGAATENIVTISGGMVDYVYGGFSQNGKVTGNTVNLIGKGGTLEGVVTNNPNVPKIKGISVGYSNGGMASGNKLKELE